MHRQLKFYKIMGPLLGERVASYMKTLSKKWMSWDAPGVKCVCSTGVVPSCRSTLDGSIVSTPADQIKNVP
jgi:hypothetical protein